MLFRSIAPDSTILVDFMIDRLAFVIENMRVFDTQMMNNLMSGKGLIFSESILIKLVDRGLSREAAYAIVQRNAMNAWENNLEFKEALLSDEELLGYLTKEEIEGSFDLEHALRWTDQIFQRVFA